PPHLCKIQFHFPIATFLPSVVIATRRDGDPKTQVKNQIWGTRRIKPTGPAGRRRVGYPRLGGNSRRWNDPRRKVPCALRSGSTFWPRFPDPGTLPRPDPGSGYTIHSRRTIDTDRDRQANRGGGGKVRGRRGKIGRNTTHRSRCARQGWFHKDGADYSQRPRWRGLAPL